MMISIKYFLLISGVFCFCSCRDEFTICELPTEVKLKTGLYEKINGSEQEAVISHLSVTRLGASAPDYNTDNVSKFNLDLNPAVDSVKYLVTINSNAVRDTITYIYSGQNVNLSVECGDIYIYNLNGIKTTTHVIDSIAIADSKINTTSGENVKIYF